MPALGEPALDVSFQGKQNCNSKRGLHVKLRIVKERPTRQNDMVSMNRELTRIGGTKSKQTD